MLPKNQNQQTAGIDICFRRKEKLLCLVRLVRSSHAASVVGSSAFTWGAIVNRSRTFARQVLTTMSAEADAPPTEQREVRELQRNLVLYQVAYVHALRQQLRGLDPVATVAHLIPGEDASELAREQNPALTLQTRMCGMLVAARRRGWLDEWQWQTFDESLACLMLREARADQGCNSAAQSRV